MECKNCGTGIKFVKYSDRKSHWKHIKPYLERNKCKDLKPLEGGTLEKKICKDCGAEIIEMKTKKGEEYNLCECGDEKRIG